MYKLLIRPFLFLLDPEKVHYLVTGILKIFNIIPLAGLIQRGIYGYYSKSTITNVWDMEFKNSVGLAAGFDKNAKHIDAFSNFGFGFIEVGTITPKPQPGNPKPRIFRLIKDRAIINRMGFNNQGVESTIENLKRRKKDIIVGGNIGKNKTTPNEKAKDDYLECFNRLYDFVDYFVVNVSSPNTPDLRELQDKEPLIEILKSILIARKAKTEQKPLLLKIAPDLSDKQLDDIIDIANDLELQGIVATNTTISRDNLRSPLSRISKIGDGGLSGFPLKERSNEIIRYLRKGLNEDIKIIGVGGILNPEDAQEKILAGASLVQIYTGFIYEGPGLIKSIIKRIHK
ncbi:quinone-dependent dihydroorotate dehydrogenase [Bacteroidota bacterium]